MLRSDILSKRVEATGKYCFNCETNLEEYILSLPSEYKDYDVQRGIVKNAYLDNLTNTVLSKNFIPPIVLISNDSTINDDSKSIEFSDYRILDGLQRTVRLENIYKAFKLYIELIKKENKQELESCNKFKLSKMFKSELNVVKTESSYLYSVIQYYKGKGEPDGDLFRKNQQWFIVWDDLTKLEQVSMMLILNAGHKSMDLKHQLELLFLNVLDSEYLNRVFKTDKNEEVKRFIRAKDVNAAYFYKNKKIGQIHLSHLLSGLIAFYRTEPFTLKQEDLQKIQDTDNYEFEKLKVFFENNNIDKVIELIEKIDLLFSKEYSSSDIGIEWLGRESVFIGLFAAFGRYYKKKQDENLGDISFESCLDEIFKLLEDNIVKYKINEFNQAKTNIDITKVNIGNVFKFTTYYATCKILFTKIEDIDWDLFFKDYSKKVDDEYI